MSKQINIGGRLHSTEQGNVITGANEVLDDTKGKKQNVINADVDAELLRLDQSKQNNLTFDNTPTENSNNPVKSSGVYAADKALSDAIDAILILIPSAATALNQLADKNFVNSSIATDTATFRGTSAIGLSEAQFLEWANGLTHDMNDYVFWQTIDEAGNTLFKRYKWDGTQWLYEYTLNNSSFTADQWAAIMSGITSALVEKLNGLPTNAALQQALNSKQNALTFDNVPTEGSNNPVKSGGVYSVVKEEEEARLNLAQTVSEIGGDVSQIEDVIPAGATELNQLVANASMEAYVASIIQNITSSFTLATADGHINLTLTQKNGQVATLTLTSSDIASAQDVANLQQLYNNLQQSKPEPVTALPETGQQQGVIYRLAGTTSYSDYMWNGTTWVLMATYNNAVDPRPKKASQNLVTSGGVFDNMGALDVSELNATENPHTPAIYVNLSAAIADIPTEYRKGGMSIQFIKGTVQSSDNKYVQFRFMLSTFTAAQFANAANWQGVVSVPTFQSNDLITSGGVNPLQLEVFGETSEQQTFEWSGASWKAINQIIPKGATVYCDSASADRTVVFATSNGQGGIGTSFSIEHFTQGKSFVAEGDLEYVSCSYALSLTIHYKYITLDEKITDIQGDITDIQGDITDIQGDITDIQGDITDIQGDVSDLETDVNGHSSEIKGIESVIDGISLTRELTLAQGGNINIPYSLKSGKKYVILVEGEIMVNVRYRVTEASAIVPIVNVLSGTYEYTASEDAEYINIYTNAAGEINFSIKEKGYHSVDANEDIPKLLIDETENPAISPQTTKNAYIKYADHTLTSNASTRTAIFKVTTGKKYDILVPEASTTFQSIAFASSASATTFDNNGCLGETSAHQYNDVIALNDYLFVSYMGSATDSPSVKLSSEKVAKYVGADSLLDARITALEQNQPTAIRHIYLPPYIHIVAGDPFELFWKSMIIAADYDSVNIKVDCPVGANYKRKFFYPNPVAGTYTMKVGVYDNNDVKLDEQTTTFIVTAAASTSPANNVNILCVGASDLVNGIWAGESHRRLVGGNGWTTGSGATGLRYPAGLGLNNITFIGGMINTITDGDNVEYTAGFEANGGWSFHEYNIAATNVNSKKLVVVGGSKTQLDIHSLYTDSRGNIWRLETIFDSTHYKVDLVTSVGGGTFPESGTLTYLSGGVDTSNIVYSGTQPVNANPFWDETNNKVSFKNYMASLGKANENIDYIYVELGESKLIGNNPDWVALKQSIITFIDNVRNATDGYPNCKIVLVRYIIPCYDGVAANYGCDYKWFNMVQRCLKLSEIFSEVAALYEGVFIVDAGIQVDLENAMQRTYRAKNQRSLENEYFQVNAMHPATMGYLQIADAVFRDMNYRLQQ